MGAWLRSLWEDEAKFVGYMRGLLGTAGALMTTLPPDTLRGWGKWGTLLMAAALFLRAGDRNGKPEKGATP